MIYFLDVFDPNSQVSSVHCCIVVRAGSASSTVYDANSTNGTFIGVWQPEERSIEWNRVGAKGETLHFGDAIKCGQTILTLAKSGGVEGSPCHANQVTTLEHCRSPAHSHFTREKAGYVRTLVKASSILRGGGRSPFETLVAMKDRLVDELATPAAFLRRLAPASNLGAFAGIGTLDDEPPRINPIPFTIDSSPSRFPSSPPRNRRPRSLSPIASAKRQSARACPKSQERGRAHALRHVSVALALLLVSGALVFAARFTQACTCGTELNKKSARIVACEAENHSTAAARIALRSAQWALPSTKPNRCWWISGGGDASAMRSAIVELSECAPMQQVSLHAAGVGAISAVAYPISDAGSDLCENATRGVQLRGTSHHTAQVHSKSTYAEWSFQPTSADAIPRETCVKAIKISALASSDKACIKDVRVQSRCSSLFCSLF